MLDKRNVRNKALTDRQTGYPSIDKPWLKYYSDEQINSKYPNCSIYEYLWENNKNHLDYYAFNYFGKKITYRRFFSMIDEAAKAFVAIGVAEKEVVPIVSISTVTSVICFYALNRIGAVPDYINVLAGKDDYISLFGEVDAKVVVTLDTFGPKVLDAAKSSGVKSVITFSVNREMPVLVDLGYRMKTHGKIEDISSDQIAIPWKEFIRRGTATEINNRHKNPEDMCLLAHTGGTTGEPKAVILNDKAMNSVVARQAGIYRGLKEYGENQTFLEVMVPFYVYGILTCTHMPLCLGWCLALIPKFDTTQWKSYIKKYKFDHAFAVPAYAAALLENDELNKTDCSCIKTLSVGGDGLNDTLEKNLNDFLRSHGSRSELYKGYGMSEICAAALVSFPGCNKIGSVGIPLPQVNMMIYDHDTGKELPYGEVGEVCLQSSARMVGYLNGTDDIFQVHDDGSEWLHTGDLGYVDDEGFLFVQGRIKRLIICTKEGLAYKVYPSVPEKVIESHESVVQSCIVGAKDGDDEVLRAFVVVSEDKRNNTERIEEELRKICEEELPSYQRPTFYVFMENLPLTAAGKVDYRELENT